MKRTLLKKNSLILITLFLFLQTNVKAAGVLDRTFSGNGETRINIEFGVEVADVAFQNDGKFIVTTKQLVTSNKGQGTR